MPLLREADPALDTQLGRRLRHRDVVEEDDRHREQDGEKPGTGYQPLGPPP